MSKKIRRRYIFYGTVQGVGFRYRAVYAARALNVTGWVKNEWDGTVVMEAQGTQEDLDDLISSITRGRFVYVDEVKYKDIPLENGEYGFHVRG
ncbi:MAG: acylphosphatase [Lachnospiraceae bacterium]|jgi:acylphosphatase